MKTVDCCTFNAAIRVAREAFKQSLQSENTNYTSGSDDVTGRERLAVILPSMLMCFLGLFSNVLALVILNIRPSEDRSTAFFYLVKALISVDLTIIVTLCPVPVATQYHLLKSGGLALCAYFTFAILLSGYGGLSIVALMAVERFMFAKFPSQYHMMASRRNLNIIIACTWLTCAFVSALPIMGVGRYSDRWPGTWCFFDYRDNSSGAHVMSLLYAGVGILIIVVTCILNATVIHHIWRMRKLRHIYNSSVSSSQSETSHRKHHNEIRTVFFLFAIIIVHTLSYSPIMIRILINQFQNVGGVEPGGIDDRLDLLALRLAGANQIIDPWIYIICRFACCSAGSKPGSQDDVSTKLTNITTVSNSPDNLGGMSMAPIPKTLFGRTTRALLINSPRWGSQLEDGSAVSSLNTDTQQQTMTSPAQLTDNGKKVRIEIEDEPP